MLSSMPHKIVPGTARDKRDRHHANRLGSETTKQACIGKTQGRIMHR